MSIIYSYPEQSILNPGDMLIGTSVEKVGGKQKNVTKNFTIQQVADFINRGAGFVDPVATDFQIPVFNQGGLKITGSIMSQDSSPSNGVAGTGITIAGTLTTTGSLTVGGGATIGDQVSNIVFDSPTKLLGPILDSGSVQGGVNQILISNQLGKVNWVNYDAGLTYQGVWNADTNDPTLTSGIGTNGHFYIVDVLGNTILNGNTDWQVGDWALFSGVTGSGGFWDKIDNTQSLTGSGTANTITMWTAGQAIGDSLISQAGTVVSVNGDLKVKDTIQATTANTNLKLKGVGTGGIEIMSADGVTDGKITLNCSQNSHGVSIQSPAHAAGQSYTLILPTSFGGPGDVLTSPGTNPSQLVWTTPTTGTVTGTGTENYVTKWSAGGTGIQNSTIFDNGNVGIGTTNTTDGKLVINSTGYQTSFETGTAGDGRLNIGHFSNGTFIGTYGDDGGAADSIRFGTHSGDERMRIASDGNVGIGNTDPNTKLRISGTQGNPANSGATSTGFLGLYGASSSHGLMMGVQSASPFGSWIQAQDKSNHATNYNLLLNPNGGNVGIGTFGPGDKLHVEGNIYLGSSSRTIYTGGSGNLSFQNNTGNMLFLRSNGSSESMRIDASGNVGIGTSSPSVSLDISATDAVQMPVGVTGDRPTTGVSNGMLRYNSTNNGFEGYVNGAWGDIGGASGVTSVSGTANRIAITGTAEVPIVNAVTGTVNSSSLTLATGQEIQSAIDLALTGALTFKGTFNATTGAIIGSSPTEYIYNCPGGAGTRVAVTIGDLYIASTGGAFYCDTASQYALNVGDEVIATATAAADSSVKTGWSVVPSQSAGGPFLELAGGTMTGNTIHNDNVKSIYGTSSDFEIYHNSTTNSNLLQSNAGRQLALAQDNIFISNQAGSEAMITGIADGAVSLFYDASKKFETTNTGVSVTGNGVFTGNVTISNASPALNLTDTDNASNIAFSSVGGALIVNSASDQVYQIGGTEKFRIASSTATFAGQVTAVGVSSVVNSATAGYFATNSAITTAQIVHVRDNVATTSVNSAGGIKISSSPGNDVFLVKRNETTSSFFGLQNSSGAEFITVNMASGNATLGAYGGGTNTGIAAYSLAVDSSGNIIEEAAGGGGASTITTNNFPGNATVGPFTLGAAPSGGSKSFVDVFIDGVYQEITTYGVVGTALTFVTAVPSGVTIETKTTSGNVSGALVSSVDIGQSTSTTGGVNLRINPIEVTSGTTELGVANSLYIFTSTTGSISTLTLPASPTSGDSIKISNIGGLANVIGANGNKIMGVAADMTINVTNAAFELIWSNIAAQGWIIIGNV